MAQLWDEDRLKKEERDRVDREMAIRRSEEVKTILDLQVDLFRKSRSEGEEHKKAEDRALLDEWHRLRQVEDELEQHHKQNEIAVRSLLLFTFYSSLCISPSFTDLCIIYLKTYQ